MNKKLWLLFAATLLLSALAFSQSPLENQDSSLQIVEFGDFQSFYYDKFYKKTLPLAKTSVSKIFFKNVAKPFFYIEEQYNTKPCSALSVYLLKKAIKVGKCRKEYVDRSYKLARSGGSGFFLGSPFNNNGYRRDYLAVGLLDYPSGSLEKISPDLQKLLKRPLDGFVARSSIDKVKVLVQLRSKQELSRISFLASSLGGANVRELKLGKLVVAELYPQKVLELASDPAVKMIWPEREVKAFLDESVPQVSAPLVWQQGFTGEGVKVAVLDTGIDSSHEMLQGKVVLEQNFTDELTASDGLGHGTHVAGIIAGSTQNGGAVNGVAPDALLINAKVLDSSGTGSTSSVVEAINWVADPDGNPSTNDGADVISISFGGLFSDLDSPINLAIADAVEAGVLVVAAAGNCSQEDPSPNCGGFIGVTTPGNSPYSLTVGAVDSLNNHASFSSGELIEGVGVKPDIVAPGVDVSSSVPDNGYASLSGTSMSTPFVSGLAALLLEANPNLFPIQLHEIIESNAIDLGVEGKDALFGSGLIDANRSLGSFVMPAEFTAFSSTHIRTSLNETVNARVQLFNFSPAPIVINEILSDSWISASISSNTIDSNSFEFVNYFIDPLDLGVGEFEGRIVVKAQNNSTLEHSVFLTVVDENISQEVDENVVALISRPSIIYVNGLRDQGVKVLGGSQIEIKVQAANPLGPTRNYAMSSQVFNPSGSLSCDLSYQTYYHQANFGRQVFFYHDIPSSAPIGVHSVTANTFYECSGTEYNGACHDPSSYTCPDDIQNNSITSSNAFTVVEYCSSGVCCDLQTNMPMDSTEICDPNVSSEYTCNNNDVYKRDYSQYCSGLYPDCTGDFLWSSWYLFDDCAADEVCIQDGSSASCQFQEPSACNSDADCPNDGYVGSLQCSGNDVVRVFRDYFCQNPGAPDSFCNYTDSEDLQFSCPAGETCSGGECVVQTCENQCNPGETVCDGEFLKSCELDSLGCYEWSSQVCFGSCIDSEPDFCQENDTSLIILAEDALTGVTVFKQPGDKLKLSFIAQEAMGFTFSFDGSAFGVMSGPCHNGWVSLQAGVTECEFEVLPSAALRYPYSFVARWDNKVKGKNVIVSKPNTVFVTDSEKLVQRYNNDVVGVGEVMKKLYLRASQNRGIVYDLADYRDEIGAAHPWGSFGAYDEIPTNPSYNPNSYAVAVANFVKRKCANGCRHVLIVGDDFVIPSVRKFTGLGPGGSSTLSDIDFVPSTVKLIDETALFFDSPVVFVVPDNISGGLRQEIDTAKQVLIDEFNLDYPGAIVEFSSSAPQVDCAPQNFFLAGKTVVVIGNELNNSAFDCFTSDNNIFNYSIRPNAWGDDWSLGRNYMFILKQNSLTEPEAPVVFFTQDLNSDVYHNVYGSDFLVSCIGPGFTEDEFLEEVACNVIPVLELFADARDTWACFNASEQTVVDQFVCDVVYFATVYDLGQYAAVIGTLGLAEGASEAGDVGVAVIKAGLRAVARELPDEVVSAAAVTFRSLSSSLIDLMKALWKQGWDAVTNGRDIIKAWVRLLGQEIDSAISGFRLWIDFGDLSKTAHLKLVKATGELEKGGRVLETYKIIEGDEVLEQVMESDTVVRKIPTTGNPTPDNQIGDMFLEVKTLEEGDSIVVRPNGAVLENAIGDELYDALGQLNNVDGIKVVEMDARKREFLMTIDELANPNNGLEWFFQNAIDIEMGIDEIWLTVKDGGVDKIIRVFEDSGVVQHSVILR